MLAHDLKEYIINNNRIEELLLKIGCTNIKPYKNQYRCALPGESDDTAVKVRVDSLSVTVFAAKRELRGDIYVLIMDIFNITFAEAIKKTHKLLGLKYSFNSNKKDNDEVEKIDILQHFKRAKRRKQQFNEDVVIIEEDEISDEYITIPYIEWVREGILPNTQKVFGIGYNSTKNRVCIPWKYWCGNGTQYVGIMGRTLNKDYKILGIPKYFPLIKFYKTMNIYGLQENYKSIQRAGYVNIFESEKSVLKRHSLLDETGGALGGHEFSDEQAKILISLNVDIIFQMDSDITEEYVWGMCDKTYRLRDTYYVINQYGLMKEKESPADKPEKVYQVLWKRKIKYTEETHKKYVKYLENKKEEDMNKYYKKK